MSNYSTKSFSSSSVVASKFTPSSKGKPCPVCKRTQDGDCRSQEQSNVVLCHTHQSGKEGEQVNGYTFLRTSDKGAGWGVWIWAGDKPIKTNRPKVEPRTTYYYDDRSGNKFIRVQRQKGKSPEFWQEYFLEDKWVPAGQVPDTVKEQMRKAVPIYRYAEVREAIAAGLTVIWCEGEVCADTLWNIGVPATTSIGGSKSYSSWGDYSKDLSGAIMAIAPDRDEQGMKYAEDVAKDHGCDNWLFAFPKSPLWNLALPKGGGLDVADWIAEGATKEDVLASIKKPSVDKGKANFAEKVKEILEQNLSESELVIAKAGLRKESGFQPIEFGEAWKAIAEEFEVTPQDLKDKSDQIAKLLDSQRASLKASEIVSPPVAAAIEELASWHNMRQEVYFSVYMNAIGSMAKNGTVLNANVFTRFRVTPNLYTIIVAESSQKKSPVLNTIAGDPLKLIQKRLKEEWKQKVEDWGLRKAEASKEGENFEEDEPQMPVIYVTKHSGEAILAQANRCPEYGIVVISDEIAGYFKSSNQYRNGNGGDKEDMLSFYDGQGGAVLRVQGLRDSVDLLNLGLMGGIQPKVLESFMKDAEDSNGNWARFSFIHQPNSIGRLPSRAEGKPIDFIDLFSEIYTRVMNFEPQEYFFDDRADAKFVKIYDRCEARRNMHPSSAMRAAWGKVAGRIAKYALNLHLENAAARGLNKPSSLIGVEILDKATKRAMLDIQQLEANYCSNENEIAAYLLKIIQISHKRGAIAARDVQQSFNKSNRPTAPTVRQWFSELIELGWGEMIGAGIKTQFKAFAAQSQNCRFVDSVDSQEPTVETVENKDFSPFVGFVGDSLKLDGGNQELDGENRGEQESEKEPTKPTNLQNTQSSYISTTLAVGNSVDSQSTEPTNSKQPNTAEVDGNHRNSKTTPKSKPPNTASWKNWESS